MVSFDASQEVRPRRLQHFLQVARGGTGVSANPQREAPVKWRRSCRRRPFADVRLPTVMPATLAITAPRVPGVPSR